MACSRTALLDFSEEVDCELENWSELFKDWFYWRVFIVMVINIVFSKNRRLTE
jgi:hypothetical protein